MIIAIEIKEILDKLYLGFEKAGLTAPEYCLLRDYITNLQERIDKAIEYIKNCEILDKDKRYPLSEEQFGDDLLNILKVELGKIKELKEIK